MGGQLWLEKSELGLGSTFCFTNIVQKYESIQVELINPSVIRTKNVLIVDDNHSSRLSLCNLILKSNMTPIVCSSAQEALIYVDNNISFDIGLIDIQMPVMDGLELAQKINDHNPNIPLIALSSLGEINDPKRLFCRCYVKPIDYDKLLKIIYQLFTESDKKVVVVEEVSDKPIKEVMTPKEQKDIKILVVEDNKTNQILILQILSNLGYQNIDVVDNGFKAIEKVKFHNYDIGLLDMKMPGMSGVTLAQEIRNWEKETQQPIKMKLIALTAISIKSERDEIMKTGYLDAYVMKPIDIGILKKKMMQEY